MTNRSFARRYWTSLTGADALAIHHMHERGKTGYSLSRRYVASLLGIYLVEQPEHPEQPEQPEQPVHDSILVVDIEKFAARNSNEQSTVAEAMSALLEEAFAEAGIDWSTYEKNSTGDGVVVLIPAEVEKSRLVDQLLHRLAAKLTSYNATRVPQAPMRLRAALHAGEVRHHSDGFVSPAINLAFRLSAARQLKEALANSPGTLALIVSEWFYEQVVRDEPAATPDSYKNVQVDVKETVVQAWIRLPDGDRHI